MRTGWANTLFFAKILKIIICHINLPLFAKIRGKFGEAPICFIPKSYLSLPMFFNSFNVMAKSKSFFGLRTGSTKSLTFQVLRGQQITKDRVYRVSNPRSEAQMTQRALIPIVAAARSQLKGLVDHSFEGVAYGETSLREFSAQNLRAGALEVTSYSPNGVSNAGFANLLVAKGTLSSPFDIGSTDSQNSFEVDGTYPPFAFPAAKAGDPATAILTYLETYGKTNGVKVLSPGTQLTFLTVYETGSVKVNTGSAGSKEASISGFVIDRIMVPNTETGATQLDDVNGIWKIQDAVSADATSVSLVNTDGDVITFESVASGSGTANVKITVNAKAASANSSNCGAALILSRFVNGVWKRNTTSIKIGYEPKYKYTFEDWLSVYQTTGSASKKYLNNGDEQTGIQG